MFSEPANRLNPFRIRQLPDSYQTTVRQELALSDKSKTVPENLQLSDNRQEIMKCETNLLWLPGLKAWPDALSVEWVVIGWQSPRTINQPLPSNFADSKMVHGRFVRSTGFLNWSIADWLISWQIPHHYCKVDFRMSTTLQPTWFQANQRYCWVKMFKTDVCPFGGFPPSRVWKDYDVVNWMLSYDDRLMMIRTRDDTTINWLGASIEIKIATIASIGCRW